MAIKAPPSPPIKPPRGVWPPELQLGVCTGIMEVDIGMCPVMLDGVAEPEAWGWEESTFLSQTKVLHNSGLKE